MSRDHPLRGGGGGGGIPRILLSTSARSSNNDGVSNTRTSKHGKWHLDLPALIVNDVVATESHFLN